MAKDFSFDNLADPFGGFTTSPYQVQQEMDTASPRHDEHLTMEVAEKTDEARQAAAEQKAVATHAAWFAIIAGIVATLTVTGLMMLGWSTRFFVHLLT